MSGSVLFVIVGRNEPLYEAEFQKRGSTVPSSDAATRQNYFVLHSSLDLVEKAAWTTPYMHLKVVDKVSWDCFGENHCLAWTGKEILRWILISLIQPTLFVPR